MKILKMLHAHIIMFHFFSYIIMCICKPYHGQIFANSSESVTLKCDIEKSARTLCSWVKDGFLVDTFSRRYELKVIDMFSDKDYRSQYCCLEYVLFMNVIFESRMVVIWQYLLYCPLIRVSTSARLVAKNPWSQPLAFSASTWSLDILKLTPRRSSWWTETRCWSSSVNHPEENLLEKSIGGMQNQERKLFRKPSTIFRGNKYRNWRSSHNFKFMRFE